MPSQQAASVAALWLEGMCSMHAANVKKTAAALDVETADKGPLPIRAAHVNFDDIFPDLSCCLQV
jgi:hypothetical protein